MQRARGNGLWGSELETPSGPGRMGGRNRASSRVGVCSSGLTSRRPEWSSLEGHAEDPTQYRRFGARVGRTG